SVARSFRTSPADARPDLLHSRHRRELWRGPPSAERARHGRRPRPPYRQWLPASRHARGCETLLPLAVPSPPGENTRKTRVGRPPLRRVATVEGRAPRTGNGVQGLGMPEAPKHLSRSRCPPLREKTLGKPGLVAQFEAPQLPEPGNDGAHRKTIACITDGRL